MNPSSPNLRHLQQLMGQLLEGVILIDLSGTILSANEAALQMHGTNHLADLGSTIEDYATRFQLRAEDGRLLKRREYPLFRLLAGDSFPDETIQVGRASEDEVRWVHRVRDVVMDEDGGEPDYLALVIGDVSAEFDAEVRFRAMFNANPAPALVIRLSDLRIVDANPGFLQLTDYPLDQLSGRGLFELDLLTGMTNAAEVRQRIMQAYPVGQTEAELLVADGNRRLVIFACQPIDVTGVDALLLTFADLEPRRQAEQALRASERHLVSIFEMAPVAMAITALPPFELPYRLRGEAYGQAGYVAGAFETPFAEGQLRVDRGLFSLGRAEARLGGGVWGGAQKGASRLDAGPSATLALPLARNVFGRVAVDWRFRVAGDAKPDSGPALTLSAGF